MRFLLTGANESDIKWAEELVEGLRAEHLLADRGYDCADFVRALNKQGIEATIPSRSNARKPRALDRERYKNRNRIERMFQRMKEFRRVATRYEKLATRFLSFCCLVGLKIWLQ